MAVLVCPGCGGRNPVDAAACAFCQCPLGRVQGRSARLAGWRPGPRAALVLVVLLVIGVLLALASRATPLLPGSP